MSDSSSIPVPASGPSPNDVLVIGKGPASEEIRHLRPMVGRAGKEHQAYCRRYNLSPFAFRTTNLCRAFVQPDQRLTPAQIVEWSEDLLAEIHHTRPRLIVAIGSDPVRFLLGNGADLKTVHGIPHQLDCLRNGSEILTTPLAYLVPDPDVCVLPVIQPAAGFHSPDTRAWINWDYSQVAETLNLIRDGLPIPYRQDPYAGSERYLDVTGDELRRELLFWAEHTPPVIGIDTEGTPRDRFSLQVCVNPGEAFMLRYDQPDFWRGIEALQRCADLGSMITGHNLGMYDLEMLRGKPHPLNLWKANCHDTLFDAYLFNTEPLGLKPNAWRHLGMKMKSHNETVGALGVEYQLDYLHRVIEHTKGWPKPDPIWKMKNDGEWDIKWKPSPVHKRVEKILADIESGRYEKDEDDEEEGEDAGPEIGDSIQGEINGTNPRKRWFAVKKDLPDLIKRVESELGPMPVGTMRRLWEKDPEAARTYACMDADAHRRLYDPFDTRLDREGKRHLANNYSANMHVYSLMQETGLPAKRSRLVALSDRMTTRMLEIVTDISQQYNNGIPFNPKSSPQKGALLKRWGLEGTKDTKGGKVSYGKKSIEHWRFMTDEMSPDERFRRELVVKLLLWGEHQHTRDMFCKPTLDRIPEDQEDCWVRGQILPWGTATRRHSMKRPNLLAQPKHSEFGKMIRACYEAPPGYVFVESDLSSIQVCIMADLSRDPDLIRNLTSGVKFHRATASSLLGIPLEDVTDAQYTLSKRIIFGSFLGQTGMGLREQLWMLGYTQFTAELCDEYSERLKTKVYPGIGKYFEQVARELRGTTRSPNLSGAIRSPGGMERLLPGIHSTDRSVAQEAVRHGVAQRIQGGEQDLMQNSVAYLKDRYTELWEMGIDVKPLLLPHDALLHLVPEEWVGLVREVVEDGLTEHCGFKLSVPVRAESKVARTWGEL